MNDIWLKIFLLSLVFALSYIISTYEGKASKNGWPAGSWFCGPTFFKFFSYLTALGAVVGAFFLPKWYCILVFIGGPIIELLLTAIFRQHVQYVSLLIFPAVVATIFVFTM